jgi:hypothetical protein
MNATNARNERNAAARLAAGRLFCACGRVAVKRKGTAGICQRCSGGAPGLSAGDVRAHRNTKSLSPYAPTY